MRGSLSSRRPWASLAPDDVIFFAYIQFGIVLLAAGHPPNGENSKSRNAEEIWEFRPKVYSIVMIPKRDRVYIGKTGSGGMSFIMASI